MCTFTVQAFAVLRVIVGDDFAVTFVITNLLCYLLKTALSFSNVHKTNIVCRVLSLPRIYHLIRCAYNIFGKLMPGTNCILLFCFFFAILSMNMNFLKILNCNN